jgi:hypothetical protein
MIVGPCIGGLIKEKEYIQKYKEFLSKFFFDIDGNLIQKALAKSNRALNLFRKCIRKVIMHNRIKKANFNNKEITKTGSLIYP